MCVSRRLAVLVLAVAPLFALLLAVGVGTVRAPAAHASCDPTTQDCPPPTQPQPTDSTPQPTDTTPQPTDSTPGKGTSPNPGPTDTTPTTIPPPTTNTTQPPPTEPQPTETQAPPTSPPPTSPPPTAGPDTTPGPPDTTPGVPDTFAPPSDQSPPSTDETTTTLTQIAAPSQPGQALRALPADRAVGPSGKLSAAGQGCDPGSPVQLIADGNALGTARADQQGDFTVDLPQLHLDAGRHTLKAICGPVLPLAAFDVAVQTSTGGSPGLAAGLLIVIILFVACVAVVFRVAR